MPHRNKFLNSKDKGVIAELEKQFPNLHFEVYSDAFLVLRPQPKLCLKYDLSWLKAGADKLSSDIAQSTQLKQ